MRQLIVPPGRSFADLLHEFDRRLTDIEAKLGPQASATPTANWLLVLDSNAKIPTIGLAGQHSEETYTIRAAFAKEVTDAVATSVFRITTTNETGANDGGAYTVLIHTLIRHGGAATNANTATKGHLASFCRAMEMNGTGVNSAITEIAETASAATDAATRDIGTVTVTVLETSEYQQDVQFNVDGTGTSVTTLSVHCQVELIYRGFLTVPVLSQL